MSFPNPEEPGALDLALETAARGDADIVLANDPDADRAAVAAKDPDTGAWRMLRGDEVGALLGAHVVARLAPPGGGSAGRRVRQFDRVLAAAGADRRRGGLRARGNPDRLQVDCPGARAAVRL